MAPRWSATVRISPLEASDDRVPAERVVADVMTRDVDGAPPEMPVHRAARRLLDHETPHSRRSIGRAEWSGCSARRISW